MWFGPGGQSCRLFVWMSGTSDPLGPLVGNFWEFRWQSRCYFTWPSNPTQRSVGGGEKQMNLQLWNLPCTGDFSHCFKLWMKQFKLSLCQGSSSRDFLSSIWTCALPASCLRMFEGMGRVIVMVVYECIWGSSTCVALNVWVRMPKAGSCR